VLAALRQRRAQVESQLQVVTVAVLLQREDLRVGHRDHQVRRPVACPNAQRDRHRVERSDPAGPGRVLSMQFSVELHQVAACGHLKGLDLDAHLQPVRSQARRDRRRGLPVGLAHS